MYSRYVCYYNLYLLIFMARRAIPMIAFPRVRCILVSTSQVCVVYVVKEVASFLGTRSIDGRGA